MAEKIKFTPAEIAAGPLNQRAGTFLATFTGIEGSQIANMSELQQKKVFLGLYKQLDLAVSLHGEDAKGALQASVGAYFTSENADIFALTQQANSLLVFGDVRNLEGTGVEHLHGRLSHFWRILGWEELRQIGSSPESMKCPVGSIEPVLRASGNLIRTLDLLVERWDEFGVGPKLVFPSETPKISRESNNGFHVARMQGQHANTIVSLTGRNEVFPTEESGSDYKEKGLLLENLLKKYPAEFAYLIFDYYVFAQGLDAKGYNVAVVQEYVVDGKRFVKVIHNGKSVLLHGKQADEKVSYEVASVSNNDVVTGSPSRSKYTISEVQVGDNDVVVMTHGAVSSAIVSYPDIVQTFNESLYADPKKKIAQFTSAIGKSKFQKPVAVLKAGKALEYQKVEITIEDVEKAGDAIAAFLRANDIQSVVVEAAHIHADTTPTKRQKKGMSIGAQLSDRLGEHAIGVTRTTMIDEDHVPNTMDHQEYVALMHDGGYSIDEVLYEASPVVREIAVAAIASIAQKYPQHLHREGDTLLFDIPGTSLQVELIKDATKSPFELGCVIFDLGLTLYKAYPELANLYGQGEGVWVHKQMFDIYNQYGEMQERLKQVASAFPPKTETMDELQAVEGLPAIPGKKQAIVNVLEGFYSAQQVKLQAMLEALGIPIGVIGVSFSEKGLHLELPEI